MRRGDCGGTGMETWRQSVVHSVTLKAIWDSFNARRLCDQYIRLRQQREKMNNSNINNYKTLHLHRTFHFKTLRDLSEGKEKFFFFLFSFRGKHNTGRGRECSHPLICFKQILALKLHSPPWIWSLRVLPPLLSVKIKQVTCSFFPQSSWPVAQNDKPV